MTALEILKMASDGIGRVVSSGDLTELQIMEARNSKRFFVDEETGLGWALLPWDLTTDQDHQREKDRFAKMIVPDYDSINVAALN